MERMIKATVAVRVDDPLMGCRSSKQVTLTERATTDDAVAVSLGTALLMQHPHSGGSRPARSVKILMSAIVHVLKRKLSDGALPPAESKLLDMAMEFSRKQEDSSNASL